MYTYAAQYAIIKGPGFFKAHLSLGFGSLISAHLRLAGLDLPKRNTVKGKRIMEYMEDVFKKTEFVIVKTFVLENSKEHLADVFYLPGEDDPYKVALSGRHLNQELIDMKLAKKYKKSNHEIDFTRKTITKKGKHDIQIRSMNFKTEVCMYINDCKQYLKAAVTGSPVNKFKTEFDPTEEEFLIIYGMKELKDLCIQVSGGTAMDWKGS